MNSILEFFLGLGLLVLFGWYFATDRGLRKRLLALNLVTLLVVFSIWTIHGSNMMSRSHPFAAAGVRRKGTTTSMTSRMAHSPMKKAHG